MVAMKCDRCGEYFDSSEVKITGGNCDNEDFGNISVRGVDNFCCKYDLCDKCAVDFFRWVNDLSKVTGGDADGQERPETVYGDTARDHSA